MKQWFKMKKEKFEAWLDRQPKWVRWFVMVFLCFVLFCGFGCAPAGDTMSYKLVLESGEAITIQATDCRAETRGRAVVFTVCYIGGRSVFGGYVESFQVVSDE